VLALVVSNIVPTRGLLQVFDLRLRRVALRRLKYLMAAYHHGLLLVQESQRRLPRLLSIVPCLC